MPRKKPARQPKAPQKGPGSDGNGLLAAIIRSLPATVVVAEAPSGKFILTKKRVDPVLERPRHSMRAGEYGDYVGFHADGRRYEPEEWPIARTIRTGESVDGEEIRVQNGDEEPGYVRVSSSPVRDADGLVIAAIGIIEDISSRKHAEEALSAEKERFRSLVETTSDWIWETDARAVYTYAGPQIRDLLGYEPPEVVGRTPYDLMPPDEVRRLLPVVRRLFAEARAFSSLENVNLHKDGRRVILESSGVPVLDANGALIGYRGIDRDITGRRHAEAALRESERQYRLLFETMHQGVIYQDARGKVISANPAALSILGVTSDEATGPWSSHEMRDAVREDGTPFAAEEHPSIAALATGREVRDVVMGIHNPREGKRRWVTVTAVPLFQPGEDRPYQAYTSFVDITERKAADDALRKIRAELEERVEERTARLHRQTVQLRALALQLTQTESRERQRLAALLHDHLQQLLVGAKFGIQIMRQRPLEGDLSDMLKDVAGLLDESIKTSRSLTAELSPPILHEAGLVAAVRWLVRWMGEKHGLTVDLDAPVEVEPDAEGVSVLLFQSVRKLLFNIVKHAKVTAARVAITTPGDSVSIIVEDGGVGFDPAQAHERGSDAGFGLFSIRERMELLGGRLDIESAVGKGSRVTLLTPLVRPAPAVKTRAARAPRPPKAPAAVAPSGGRIRVLVADDHAIMRQGLIQLLQREPSIAVVGEAGDGVVAVEMAHDLRPDVVVMDLSMPRMNGIEATERITESLPGIAVIGLSMYEKADRAAAMFKAGASAYLTKDGPSQDLIAAIKAARPK